MSDPTVITLNPLSLQGVVSRIAARRNGQRSISPPVLLIEGEADILSPDGLVYRAEPVAIPVDPAVIEPLISMLQDAARSLERVDPDDLSVRLEFMVVVPTDN